MNIAVRAARAGGRVLTKYIDRLDSITVETKGLNDFVSEVDRQAEVEIINTLAKSYPDHCFIGEESGQTGDPNSPFKWYIDPLDGTKNYIHGFPSFCVSIAAAQHDRLEQGVIYNPISQELFAATRGGGATLDGKRLRVSKCMSIDNALLTTGFPSGESVDRAAIVDTFSTFYNTASGVRCQGSAALELAYVAAGRIDGYWQKGLKKWDIAAGELIVREAGGLISDTQGEEGWFESGDIVAGTPKVFASMIRTLKQ